MSLAKRAVSGAAWSIAANVGSRALGLIGMVVLVRLLVPAEYGEVTAAASMVAIVNQVLMVNLGMYITSNPKCSDSVLFHAHALHMGTGVVACLVAILLGDQLGSFFGAPGMGRYVPWLAVAALIDRAAYIPDRLILNQLNFRTSAMARTAGETVFATGSVALAFAGFGPMSIVWASLARPVIRGLLVYRSSSWLRCVRPHRIDLAILRKLTTYGIIVNSGAIAAFAATRIDNLLVSRMFGTEILAYYNLAYNLSEVPSAVVGEQISDVLAVTYSQMSVERRLTALVRSLGIVALLVFPLAVGLGATAPTLVAAFLKPGWRLAGTMMMVLATMSIAKPLITASFSYLFSQGRQATFAKLQGFLLALIVVSVASLGRLGPLWVCGSVAICYGTMAVVSLSLIVGGEGFGLVSLLARLTRPLLACIPMTVVVVLVHLGMQRLGVAASLSLVAEIVAGAVVYVASALVIARDTTSEVIRLLRDTIQRRRAVVASQAAP